jgi:RNA polymerase sigma-70 factor (ECF subfamily)
VTRLKQGDEGAWEEFVAAHRHRLIGFFRKLGFGGDVPEEIAEETFVRAFRSMGNLLNHDRLDSWLFSVARCVAADYLRYEGRRPGSPGGKDNAPFSPASPDWNRLREVLACLEPDDKDILYLSGVAGLSGPEIAALTGCSQVAVRKRLSRARQKVRSAAEQTARGASSEKARDRAAP